MDQFTQNAHDPQAMQAEEDSQVASDQTEQAEETAGTADGAVGDDAAEVVTSDNEPDATQKLVPVTEAIRYRKRAQAAERQLQQLHCQRDELQAQLDTAQQTIDQLDRRTRIDHLLREAETIDLEAARLLTEQAVRMMDQPDITLAVNDLKRDKPYLFRRRGVMAGSAMAARPQQAVDDTTELAAQQAVESGHRRDLLHYLRLRRRG